MNTVPSPLQNAFLFNESEIRTAVDDNGEVWLCAKDVFESLDITWKGASGSLKNTPEKWQGVCYLQTPGGTQEAIFLSEAAVYQTAFTSRKPEAVQFANWVCEEVLPSIRKQGFYGTIDAKARLAYSKQVITLVKELTTCKDGLHQSMLISELRDLCNLIGRAMPDLTLLGTDPKQLALEV